jgi:hypothetical protein
MLLLLLACAAPETPDNADPVAFCEGGNSYRYAPDTVLETFPDDHWTVEDSGTTTGLRVHTPPGDPAFAAFPDAYTNLLDQLGTLDGFGLTPALVMQFDLEPPADAEIVLLVEEGGVWTRPPFTQERRSFGRTLHVTPWRPLPPGARGVLAVRTDAAQDACVSPPAALRTLLTDDTVRLADRYAEGVAALGWEVAEVGAMVVFTTQSAEEVDAAVAADVAARSYGADAPFVCTDEGRWLDCRGTITVGDYRADDGTVPEGPVGVRATYALPVAVWLPTSAAAPYPVAVCGHGLGGSKSQCEFLAELAADRGVATIAVDAQQHGDHPLRTADGDLDQIMALFGFTIDPPSLDALVLRDNFRASAWDKLQIVRALEGGLDLDGDGAPELDGTRIQYVGASLGGIMGPELMAWSPSIQAGALVVPGGGLMNLVIDSDSFGVIAQVMTPPEWDEDDLARTIPLVQTLVDAGDPLVHAAAITRRRVVGVTGPDLLLLMAYADTIVPNTSTAALSQALGVTGVGPELLPIDGVSFGAGPVSGNLADGRTGALLQFAETQPYDGAEWETADHSTLHESVQAAALLPGFVTAVFDGEVPVVTDPGGR